MTYTLERLAGDIRDALNADAGDTGRQKVCEHVAEALKDDDFVATHLKDRASGAHPREVLFEDPDLGFCICGHVYDGSAKGSPHDHGPSWAIYGQAEGQTEMTDWRIVEPGDGENPSLVEPVETYTMTRGDARAYDVGDVHSPDRDKPTRLLRIEGKNLDNVERSKIKAK